MKAGKSFSSRKSGGGGRGRISSGKKSFGKKKDDDKRFSRSGGKPAFGKSKPFTKRDDRDERPSRNRSESPSRFGDKKEFRKPMADDKKFATGRSKPFSKRDDRDEKPSRNRSESPSRFGDKKEFKKPFDKKFSAGRSKPFSKRDDRDERPTRDRSDSDSRPYAKKEFSPHVADDKKFPARRSKPFSTRDDQDERPARGRSGSYLRSDDKKDFKKPFDKKISGGRSKPFSKRDDRDEKPSRNRSESYSPRDEKKEFSPPMADDKKFSAGKSKLFFKRDDRDEKPARDRSESDLRPDDKKEFRKPIDKKFSGGKSKPFSKREDRDEKAARDRSETFHPSDDGKDFIKRDDRPTPSERPRRTRTGEKSFDRLPHSDESSDDVREDKSYGKDRKDSSDKPDPKWNRKSGHEFYGDRKKSTRPGRNDRKEKTEYVKDEDGSIRLNKFISNSGICSRREADELITAGVISINGEIMTELGYKVKPGDEVKYNNETLRAEKLVYILVNKPKDFITTVDDPQDRKTVMWLIKDACRERVYPVGRLDRNTTGVLLFTNDGELAKKLTHPAFEVQKIYQVELDSPLKSSDMEQIANGLNMEDGFIKVDDIAYSAVGKDKSVVGVELHSGKNRIVRRIFEHFGYYIKKLDRVYFAGLSKKDLPRGRWRFLTPIEVSNLKMMTGEGRMKKYYEA